MWTIPLYIVASFAEIAGCFSFWAWLRLGKTPLVLIPGMVSLAIFAWVLSHIDAGFAGRAYAAYGGIYIVASLFWMWAVEGVRPDGWDAAGGALCVFGALTIILGHYGGR